MVNGKAVVVSGGEGKSLEDASSGEALGDFDGMLAGREASIGGGEMEAREEEAEAVFGGLSC